RREVHTYY
nr:Chain C, ARG-ARG-GLU-VAL-HIS-THR-TYR-TYR [Influenza A virus (A/Chicken/Hong Kong/715.5/01 (H5N1))]